MSLVFAIPTSADPLYADFDSSGLWMYDGTWTRISTGDAEADGGLVSIGSDLYVDFGSSGLYKYNGTTWTRISTGNPEGLGKYNNKLVADFGSSGLFLWDGSWTRISTGNCEDMDGGDTHLDVDFGVSGFWRYSGGTWARISSGNPNGLELDTPEAPVEKSGQTTCIDPFGNTISCALTNQFLTSPSTGMDGEIQKGIPWPTPRFTDNGDGTITDNLTGLIWLKNANCFGNNGMWFDVFSYSNSLANGSCGLSDGSSAGDWRLPNVRELHSLIDYGRDDPALSSGHPFTGVQPKCYWTSTPSFFTIFDAWVVRMNNGIVDSEAMDSQRCYVWPVRSD
jgi:hypothetical protein